MERLRVCVRGHTALGRAARSQCQFSAAERPRHARVRRAPEATPLRDKSGPRARARAQHGDRGDARGQESARDGAVARLPSGARDRRSGAGRCGPRRAARAGLYEGRKTTRHPWTCDSAGSRRQETRPLSARPHSSCEQLAPRHAACLARPPPPRGARGVWFDRALFFLLCALLQSSAPTTANVAFATWPSPFRSRARSAPATHP